MKHALTMEAIGYDARCRRPGARLNPKAWAAKLVRMPDASVTRHYLKPHVGYRGANSVASRGVVLTFLLEERFIYEVEQPLSWTRSRHYFVTHDGRGFLELTAREAVIYV